MTSGTGQLDDRDKIKLTATRMRRCIYAGPENTSVPAAFFANFLLPETEGASTAGLTRVSLRSI